MFSAKLARAIEPNCLAIGSIHGINRWLPPLMFLIEAIYRYCKIGNPGRITAFNFWI